jgi:hypothetical protein
LFTFDFYSNQYVLVGHILNVIGYVPFIIAFLIGFFYGKECFLKVGLCGLLVSVISSIATIWDLNHSVEGGWSGYGSTLGLIIVIIIFTFGVGILTLFGGWLRTKLSHPPNRYEIMEGMNMELGETGRLAVNKGINCGSTKRGDNHD